MERSFCKVGCQPGSDHILPKRLIPDHKTIADFGRDNSAAIRRVCAQSAELWRRISVLKGDTVAVDGSKFKAVNSRDPTFSKGKTASRPAHPEVEVGRYIEDPERIDRQETGEARTERAAHLTGRDHRIWREIERLLTMGMASDDTPDGQISLTDPDARAMATRAQHSGHVGYTVQSFADADAHLIIPHEGPGWRLCSFERKLRQTSGRSCAAEAADLILTN